MITVKNGTAMETVPTVMLDTFSREEFVLKVMPFVKTLMPMELVPLATQDTFWITEVVFPFQNWPHSLCTTLNVVLKN